MKSVLMKQFPILFCLVLAAQLQAAKERKLDPLPVQVSNNAVAISHDGGKTRIFSFMGIGPKKTWNAITTRAFELDPGSGEWMEKRPVPGVVGRLAASAIAIHDQVFIFGGYIVDSGHPGVRPCWWNCGRHHCLCRWRSQKSERYRSQVCRVD